MKARSIDPVRFEVAKMITLVYFFRLSSCVSKALTARIASDGSDELTWRSKPINMEHARLIGLGKTTHVMLTRVGLKTNKTVGYWVWYDDHVTISSENPLLGKTVLLLLSAQPQDFLLHQWEERQEHLLPQQSHVSLKTSWKSASHFHWSIYWKGCVHWSRSTGLLVDT